LLDFKLALVLLDVRYHQSLFPPCGLSTLSKLSGGWDQSIEKGWIECIDLSIWKSYKARHVLTGRRLDSEMSVYSGSRTSFTRYLCIQSSTEIQRVDSWGQQVMPEGASVCKM
jgi:hypothetical protein